MKCDESLRPLCNAILKNIDKYPFKPQLSNYYKTEEYQKKRHPNKQSKGANTEYVKNPISEYPITDDANERLHYTTMELARANSKLLSALTPDILDAILTFGNVTAVEYFKFMIDPTYQNPNLEDLNNARKFYFLTYKHFFKSISLENNELKLFHYFTVESILKGTILFSFCNFFCNNTWDRFIKNIGGLDSENGKKIISGIFKNINTIDNPFLKELIIEKILPDSYYHTTLQLLRIK